MLVYLCGKILNALKMGTYGGLLMDGYSWMLFHSYAFMADRVSTYGISSFFIMLACDQRRRCTCCLLQVGRFTTSG